MEVRYRTRKLEKQCLKEREMKKAFPLEAVRKGLKRRIHELYLAESFDELLKFPGKWEELRGERKGQWSARLNGNWRIIVCPVETDGQTHIDIVQVEEVVDYH